MKSVGIRYGERLMNKRPQVVAQTKENFLQAFWMLYKQKGIDGISVSDLVKSAGYNRSTFYEYFKNIRDLLDRIEDSLLEEINEQIINHIENDLDDKEAIRLLAVLYQEKGEYLSVLLSENGDPQFVKKIKDVMRPQIARIFRLNTEDLRTKYVIELGMSSIIGTLTYWYSNGMDLPAEELAALFHTMILPAIIPFISQLDS